MKSKSQFIGWLAVAGIVVNGCGGPDRSPDGGDGAADTIITDSARDITDSARDVVGMDSPITETGADAGNDTGALDVPATDGGPDASGVDSSTDVPVVSDPCTAGSVVNLNTAGTLTGNTLNYNGDLRVAPAAPPTGFSPSCQGNTGHVIAYAYTVRANSRLLVSTFHNDGAHLDTVIVVKTACTASGGTAIGCGDDVPSEDSNRLPTPGNTTQSILTTNDTRATDGTTAAGTTVYIFVAGFQDAADAFHLSVTEITPPSAAGGACEPAAMPSLCATGLGCAASGTDNSTFSCIADGILNGNCHATGTACDSGLGCNSVNLCVPMVTLGGSCDPTGAGNVCATGSTCGTIGTTSTCVADGAQGGQCRGTTPACDTMLDCNASNVCVPIIAAGGACDPTSTMNLCATASSCVTVGTSSTCIADGAGGGQCRSTAPECDGTLICSTAGTCIPTIAVGDACDPTGVANTCVAGSLCTTDSTGSHCQIHTYVASASTATWIDACAATGSTVLLAGVDDDTAAVMLPFAFTFYGTAYPAGSMGTVSSNGFFSPIDGVSDNHAATAFPQTPNGAIYALLTDLIFRDVGTLTPGVCVATTGTTPNRVFTLEWNHEEFFTGVTSGDYVTMEIQLHEGSPNFDILYETYMGNTTTNTAAGVESPTGTPSTVICVGDATTGCSATTAHNTLFTAMP